MKILLPFRVFAEKEGVSRIVAETPFGAFGILPQRLDCVAALTPGILTYENEEEGEVFVAVDQGVLVKTGTEVLISVRNAIGGAALGALREAVEQDFLQRSEEERSLHVTLAKLESDFIRRFTEFQKE